MNITPAHFKRSTVSMATAYADQSDEETDTDNMLEIPEDFAALSDSDLDALHAEAVETFDALYGEGADLSTDDMTTLASLTEGIESLQSELSSRGEAAAERAEAAAQLRARIRPEAEAADEAADEAAESTESAESAEAEAEAEAESAEVEADEAAAEPELIAASGARKSIRVRRGTFGKNAYRAATAASQPSQLSDVMSVSGEGLGIAPGKGVDFGELAKGLDRRLTSFNKGQFDMAARQGRQIREQHQLATIRKPFKAEHIVASNDPKHVSDVMAAATDESQLPGGSLVAAGGWCAPSETLYDLFTELESRDGLLSLPEINLARGGVRWSAGPSFADIFANITGFSYTEAEDIAGDYDGAGAGAKPCHSIECPDFDEIRLGVDGLCLTAGLLQSRGYPELIARTLRGAMIAHDHRINARLIEALVADSTEVTLPTTQVGVTAPLLTAIELQVEHYRYTHRMLRSTTLEGVFPFWVRGAIRADLARRNGVDLLSVPDARVDAWFRERGINPQFVYNWQNLDAAGAAATVSYPDSVDFLLYAAGTWVRGSSDVITLDNLYDSTLLGTNDYTALFTEEGFAAIKAGHDSRLVTVGFSQLGAAAMDVAIALDGTGTAAAGE